MTKREQFLRRMRNDNPDWLGNPWNCFGVAEGCPRPLVNDAITLMDPMEFGTYKDSWGATWCYREGEPAPTPVITEENKVVKDITQWKKYLKFPDITELDWSQCVEEVKQIDREEYLVMAPSYTGMFEFSHLMLGFEDSCVAFLEEPEAMDEMLAAYTDWKILAAEIIIDKLHPDIIHSHDDWGSKQSMFLSPTVWREHIKPHFARLYKYYEDHGVLVQHHSDSVNDAVVEDMVEMGISMWQGCIPQNDIVGVIRRTNGKLCILGGIDMQICDMPDWSEEVIRKEVRRAIDTYAPLGCFMPVIENIWAIYPEVGEILDDEMERYGAAWMKSHR